MTDPTSPVTSTAPASPPPTATPTAGGSPSSAPTTSPETLVAARESALAAAAPPPPQPKARPEGLPDAFWDKDKAEIKLGDLTKSYEELRQAKAVVRDVIPADGTCTTLQGDVFWATAESGLHVITHEGVVTLDMGPNWDPKAGPIGALAPAQVEQVIQIKAAVERARRRYRQLKAAGLPADLAKIHAAILQRDLNDLKRKINPLSQAADARIIDSTHLSMRQVAEKMLRIIRGKA